MTENASAEAAGAVTGGLRTLLRLEGLTLFVGMTLLYAVWDGSWWVYAIVFLVPDLSFAAYLAGPRAGAIIYNAAHSYMAPMALMTTGFAPCAGEKRRLSEGCCYSVRTDGTGSSCEISFSFLL